MYYITTYDYDTMRNRTIHFTKAHQMPLRQVSATGELGLGLRSGLVYGLGNKSALSKLLLLAQVSYEFVEGHKICIFIAHMKE